MILHIVLFEPRAELVRADRVRLLDDIRQAATAIPQIKRLRVGRRMQHGLPGYEQGMREGYDYVAVIEFDDRAGLLSYLQHPAHETISRHFTESASRALAYDYETSDAASADAAGLI